MSVEGLGDERRSVERTCTVVRLQRTQVHAVWTLAQVRPDVDDSGFDVEVDALPCQCQSFSRPQSDAEHHRPQGVQTIPLSGLEEPLSLLW